MCWAIFLQVVADPDYYELLSKPISHKESDGEQQLLNGVHQRIKVKPSQVESFLPSWFSGTLKRQCINGNLPVATTKKRKRFFGVYHLLKASNNKVNLSWKCPFSKCDKLPLENVEP